MPVKCKNAVKPKYKARHAYLEEFRPFRRHLAREPTLNQLTGYAVEKGEPTLNQLTGYADEQGEPTLNQLTGYAVELGEPTLNQLTGYADEQGEPTLNQLTGYADEQGEPTLNQLTGGGLFYFSGLHEKLSAKTIADKK